jgi:hypothetical protein
VYFEGSPLQQKNPRALCWGELVPSILDVPMFPWKYFSCMKQERSEEIKRELFT